MRFLCSIRWAWCATYGGINSGPPVLVVVIVDFITIEPLNWPSCFYQGGGSFLRQCPWNCTIRVTQNTQVTQNTRYSSYSEYSKYSCTQAVHQCWHMVRMRYLHRGVVRKTKPRSSSPTKNCNMGEHISKVPRSWKVSVGRVRQLKRLATFTIYNHS